MTNRKARGLKDVGYEPKKKPKKKKKVEIKLKNRYIE